MNDSLLLKIHLLKPKSMRHFLSFLFLFLTLGSFAQTPNVPAPTSKAVSDFAELLSDEEEKSLSEVLIKFYDKTTNQLGIVTVPVAWQGDANIKDYSLKLAKTWQLGQKNRDNGLMILVVGRKDDKKGRGIRIEVGKGLKTKLPNEVCQSILDNQVVPSFKQGNYAQGLEQGILSLQRKLDPNYNANADATTENQTETTPSYTNSSDYELPASKGSHPFFNYEAIFAIIMSIVHLVLWNQKKYTAIRYVILIYLIGFIGLGIYNVDILSDNQAAFLIIFGIIAAIYLIMLFFSFLGIKGSNTYGSSSYRDNSYFNNNYSSYTDYSSSNYSSSDSSSSYDSSSSSSDYSGGGGDYGGGGADSSW